MSRKKFQFVSTSLPKRPSSFLLLIQQRKEKKEKKKKTLFSHIEDFESIPQGIANFG
tara:strand:- start:773 stop:943 length:171 start_codon:yes stop_codon:yes gene_type:complete